MDCNWKLTLQRTVTIQIAIYLWKNVNVSKTLAREKSVSKDYKLDHALSTLKCTIAKLPMPKLYQQDLLEVIRPIGMHILTWFDYHTSLFSDRATSVDDFVYQLVWTSEGSAINHRKTAKNLIEKNLVSQVDKYQLACIYCLDKYVFALWEQVKDDALFIDLQCPGAPKIPALIKHWATCMTLDLDHCECIDHSLHNVLHIDINHPVMNGFFIGLWTKNLTAIKYFWKLLEPQLNVDDKRNILINSAAFIAKQRYNLSYSPPFHFSSEYCAPILLFLLSKMSKHQQIETFRKDISSAEWSSGVLRCFLDWPYQPFFMQSARCIGLLLPSSHYTRLLLAIVEKMTYEIDYNYHLLFTEFWEQNYSLNKHLNFQEIGELLINLFFVDDFSGNDLESIRTVLENVSAHERQKMLTDFKGRCICFSLVRRQKWDLLEMLAKSCRPYHEVETLKKEIFLEVGKEICQALIINEKNWKVINEFLSWSCLTELERMSVMKTLQKYEMNYNKILEEKRKNTKGRRHRRHHMLSDPQRRSGGSLSSLVRWCHPLPKPLDNWKMLCFVAKFVKRSNNNRLFQAPDEEVQCDTT